MSRATNLQLRASQLRGYTRTLVSGIQALDQRRYILEPLISDAAVTKALHTRLNNTHAGWAFQHLRPLLANDLVRDICRLYFDTQDKACSLVRIMSKLEHDELRDIFRQEAASLADWLQPEYNGVQLPPISGRSAESLVSHFDESYSRLSSAVRDLEASAEALKLRTFRDKYIAHLEMQPAPQAPEPFNLSAIGLTYGEVFAFIDHGRPLIFELSTLITGVQLPDDQWRSTFRRNGLDLWRLLAGLSELQD